MKAIRYKDIIDLREVVQSLSEPRLRNLLREGEAQEVVRFLLNRSASDEVQAVRMLRQHFTSELGDLDLPGMQCNCPEPADTRWHKVAAGEPVTWAYNPRKQPITAGRLLRQAFQEVQNACGIVFQGSAHRSCDICVGWDELDGKGKTLEVTFVPATGDRLEACGPLCGDILFDTAEYWGKNQLFITVARHAICHAVGVGHNSRDRNSLMYPYVSEPKHLTPDVVAELLKRYPK